MPMYMQALIGPICCCALALRLLFRLVCQRAWEELLPLGFQHRGCQLLPSSEPLYTAGVASWTKPSAPAGAQTLSRLSSHEDACQSMSRSLLSIAADVLDFDGTRDARRRATPALLTTPTSGSMARSVQRQRLCSGGVPADEPHVATLWAHGTGSSRSSSTSSSLNKPPRVSSVSDFWAD